MSPHCVNGDAGPGSTQKPWRQTGQSLPSYTDRDAGLRGSFGKRAGPRLPRMVQRPRPQPGAPRGGRGRVQVKIPAGEGRGGGDSTHRGWRYPRHVEWKGELVALISGVPKSWPPNSGCGGLGSAGQQEVTQRPACPSPCAQFSITGARSCPGQCLPTLRAPPAGGPPPRTVLSQSLGLTPAHLHARFHWLRTHRLGPGFPGCGGGAWGARFWGDHAGWDGGWHWALRALGWLSGRLALLGHSGEPEG